MKKLLALSVLVLTLTGCSESAVKKETEDLIKNDYKEVLSNDLNANLKEKAENFEKELYTIAVDPLNLEGENVDLKSVKGYDQVIKTLSEIKGQTEYEFKNVDIEDDHAKVLLELKYKDAGVLIEKAISESMDKASLEIYNGGKLTKKDHLENLLKTIQEELDGAKLKVETNDKVEVDLEKKEDWKISQLNENAVNAISLNFAKHEDSLKKKANETKQNLFFLETESNLRKVWKSIAEVSKDKKISYKDIQTKNVSKEIKNKTGLNSAVVKKVGKEENFYYILKTGSSRISVVVIRDGERYKFSDKLK